MRRAATLVAIGFLALGLGWVLFRVVGHDAEERAAWSEPRRLEAAAGQTVEIVRTRLAEGQNVTFTACADDRFEGESFRPPAAFILRHHDPDADIFAAELDEARMGTRRVGSAGACVQVGHADSLTGSGEFSVALRPSEGRALPGASVWAGIVAFRQLGADDVLPALFALLGALGLVLAFLLPAPSRAPAAWAALEEPADASPSSSDESDEGDEGDRGNGDALEGEPYRLPPLRALGVGLAVFVTVSVVAQLVPSTRPMAYAMGLALFLAQLLSAAALVRAPGSGLGLRSPEVVGRLKRAGILLSMPFLGALLRVGARAIGELFPVTGTAPIEHLVSFPSGLIGTLAIGFVAPIAEEIFFRGLVFTTLERSRGKTVALALTTILFAIVHLPQTWGAWPSFVSVSLVGLALTSIRALTGSTVASALAHLGYNVFTALPAVIAILAAGT